MTTETIESEFVEVLSTIADGLGIAAERIFEIFVSAQVMLGIINIVIIMSVLLGALFFGWYTRRLCIKAWRDEDGDWADDDNKAASVWVPLVVAVVALLFTWEITAALGRAAMMIICPDYSAMCEIIELVTP